MSFCRSSTCHTLLVLGLAGCLSASLLHPPRASGPTLQVASFQVLTDRLQSMEGAVVVLSSPSEEVVLVADGQGMTPWTAFPFPDGLDLTLVERVRPGGIAIGMRERAVEILAADWGTAHTDELWLSRTQPLAVPVQVAGLPNEMNDFWPPAGDHPHWTLLVPPDSRLRFGVHLAPLLDADAIQHCLDYRGHLLPDDHPYVRGLVMVVPRVQLGDDGIVVVIDLLGDLTSGAVVDAYHFTLPPHLPHTGPPLAAQVVAFTEGHVAVRVTGGLSGGYLALAARAEGTPAQVFVMQDGAPTITIPPFAGGGVQYVLGTPTEGPQRISASGPLQPPAALSTGPLPATACVPEPDGPPPGWTCTNTTPSNNCGSGIEWLSQNCQVGTTTGPVSCRPPGTTVSKNAAKGSSWKVTFRMGGSAPAGARKLESGGGFEYGEESSTVQEETWTAQAGAHGLGQCISYYRLTLVCVTQYLMTRDKWVWELPPYRDPCSEDYYVNDACTKEITGATVCDRTP